MTHMPHPPHRVARWFSWSSVIIVLSAGSSLAQSPPPPAPNQPVMRGAQVQVDQDARRQPVQDVSAALGQRLGRMLLATKPAPER
jgi:hypothetical protein